MPAENSAVLFLLPYPLHKAPSQRFRVEAFFDTLHKKGILFSVSTFLDDQAWEVLYKKGSALQKVLAVVKGFLSRAFTVLFTAHRYQYIFVHREAAPLGPPLFEWLLTKVFRKKLIFDFDDAIWIPNTSAENKIAARVKCFWKIPKIIKWAYKVSAGNNYLAAYARKYNNRVQVVPTCVDTETRFNRLKDQATPKVVIGWTGSHSTLSYLDELFPVLQKLEMEFDFSFLVICNKPPQVSLSSLIFMPWKESSEVDDLLKINIGVMPLAQDAWSEGKCGFKIIQYLSLGIPAVASPVGVNKQLIENEVNGKLASSSADWYHSLAMLIQNEAVRRKLGAAGRKKIESAYSIAANAGHFLSLFS